MARYFLIRVMTMLGILLGVLVITFLISRVLPGSPVEVLLGSKPTPEQIAAKKAELGLDKPILVQLGVYIGGVLQGDFGVSLASGRSVWDEMMSRLPATLELVTAALFLSLIIGVPLGVIAAVKNNTWADNLIRLVSAGGIAMPIFFLGPLLQMLFYANLRVTPLQGRIDSELELDHPFEPITGFYLIDPLIQGNFTAWFDAIAHMILPVLTLGIATAPIFVRITRNMVVETLGSDHFKTMLAYRLSPRKLYGQYAVRSSFIPLLTVVGLAYGYMIGGSVIVEYIYDFHGLGGYVVNSLVNNDFNAVMGVTILLSTIYLIVNLLVDFAYFALDPRLRS